MRYCLKKRTPNLPKAFVVGLLHGLALLVLVDVGALRLGHQSAEEAAFQKELPDPTPVPPGPVRFCAALKRPTLID